MIQSPPKILAISSGGGHWVELLMLRPAFDCETVIFATVRESYQRDVDGCDFRLIEDGNFSRKWRLVKSAFSILRLLLVERPDTVISTGAAPGYFAVFFGKILGMRTVWVDSIANADELSMSGRNAGICADLWITQWEHLAVKNGPKFYGSVLSAP